MAKAKKESEYKNIWIVAEQLEGHINEVTVELLGVGHELANDLGCELYVLVGGHDIKEEVQKLLHYGVDGVIYAEHELLKDYVTEGYAEAYAQIIKEAKPEIVLMSGTSVGKDLGPRIAAKLDTGITADCTKLEINKRSKKLMQTKPAFGGNYMATIVTNTYPQMVTIRPRLMDKAPYNEEVAGNIMVIKPKLTKKGIRTKLVDKEQRDRKGVNLIEANLIVAGGRGMKNEEGFKLVYELADKLGGEVGASRAAVDNGWIDYVHQVGQTGTIVKPELYIALGISGSSQHLAGMVQSRHIIAVNRDRYAPIFSYCDYGIIGDVFEIVPAMMDSFDIRKKFEL